MKRHGGNIEALRARQVSTKDFERFDIILAMDGNNERDLRRLAPSDTARRKVRRMMEFATAQGTGEVPDPYYGADSGFDEVHRMLMDACEDSLTPTSMSAHGTCICCRYGLGIAVARRRCRHGMLP